MEVGEFLWSLDEYDGASFIPFQHDALPAQYAISSGGLTEAGRGHLIPPHNTAAILLVEAATDQRISDSNFALEIISVSR